MKNGTDQTSLVWDCLLQKVEPIHDGHREFPSIGTTVLDLH